MHGLLRIFRGPLELPIVRRGSIGSSHVSLARLFMAAMLCALLVLTAAPDAAASVSVFPTEVFVSPQNRSAPLVVRNPSDSEVEVWLSFTFGVPVSYANREVEFDTVETADRSAATWLRAVPQRFILQPQESQTVRLFATPPVSANEGEYWARVVVSSKPTQPVKARQDQRGPTLAMNLVTQTVVPFHLRRGKVSSGVLIKQAVSSVSGRTMHVKVDLERNGNASYWGRLQTRLLDQNGKLVRGREFRVVVYKDLSYTADLDISQVQPGQYTLEVMLDNKHPSLSSKERINSPPVTQRFTVSVP